MHEEFGVSLDLAGDLDITPLDAAIRHQQHAAFDYLLEKGADFRRVDKRGDSLVSIAARENNADALEVLLRRGVSVEGSGKSTMTPLMTAACTDAAKAAKVLLDNNANIDATHEGLTARALAECEGHQKTLAVIDAEARRRHLLAVEKDAAHAHGGVQGEVRVRKPLSFKMRPM
jgi:ankyrin repeat protein